MGDKCLNILGNLKERDSWEKGSIDGRIILKRILGERDWRMWIVFM
jgi:hypothetical protein